MKEYCNTLFIFAHGPKQKAHIHTLVQYLWVRLDTTKGEHLDTSKVKVSSLIENAVNIFIKSPLGYFCFSSFSYMKTKCWLNFTWLDLTWLDLTWLDLTWLDLTWLDLTWLDLTWLDLTWLDLTWLDLTWLDSKWLYSTWLYLTSVDFIPLNQTLLDFNSLFAWFNSAL